MKRLICLLVILCTFYVLMENNAFSQSAPHNMAYREEAIVKAVNTYRIKHGWPALKSLPLIAAEARQHSLDMERKRIPFGHQYFMTRIKHIYAKISNGNGGSENVAWFPPSKSPEEVVRLWLTSRGHRHNIEGHYNLTGVGIVQDKRGWYYYTQLFIRTR